MRPIAALVCSFALVLAVAAPLGTRAATYDLASMTLAEKEELLAYLIEQLRVLLLARVASLQETETSTTEDVEEDEDEDEEEVEEAEEEAESDEDAEETAELEDEIEDLEHRAHEAEVAIRNLPDQAVGLLHITVAEDFIERAEDYVIYGSDYFDYVRDQLERAEAQLEMAESEIDRQS